MENKRYEIIKKFLGDVANNELHAKNINSEINKFIFEMFNNVKHHLGCQMLMNIMSSVIEIELSNLCNINTY